MNGAACNCRSSQRAAAFPEALQEASFCTVGCHCLGGQEVELHHLHPLGKQVGLEVSAGSTLSHHYCGCNADIPQVGILSSNRANQFYKKNLARRGIRGNFMILGSLNKPDDMITL